MSITMSADAHTQLTNHINELGREVRELKKQNKELKEENKKLKSEDDTLEDTLASLNFYAEQCAELKAEIKKLKEQFKKLQDEDHIMVVDADTESEEETEKYDGDDWRWVYGKTVVDKEDEDTGEEWKEVVLCMAGGGDHWENWIMTPTTNYIENKDGRCPQGGLLLIQSSCGKYLSFQYQDYECEGDECICNYDYDVEDYQ